jgi:hemin uptake protein HemP
MLIIIINWRGMVLEQPKKTEMDGVSKVRRLTTESLFEGRAEIFIVHGGEEYRLRITKNDKLILTK